MKVCQICGHNNKDDAVTCDVCGFTLEDEPKAPVTEQLNISNIVNEPDSQDTKEHTDIINDTPSNDTSFSIVEKTAEPLIDNNEDASVPSEIENYNSKRSKKSKSKIKIKKKIDKDKLSEIIENIALIIFSLAIPFVGFILGVCFKDEKKKLSKYMIGCSILSLVIYITIGGIVKHNMSDTVPNTNSSKISEINTAEVDWTKCELTVGETQITLPTNFETVKQATGDIQGKFSQFSGSLRPNYNYISDFTNDKKTIMYVKVRNSTIRSIDNISDCGVIGISSNYESKNPIIIFPGDMYVGKIITEDEIESTLGTPSITDNNNSILYSFNGSNEKSYYIIEVNKTNNKILSLRIATRD